MSAESGEAITGDAVTGDGAASPEEIERQHQLQLQKEYLLRLIILLSNEQL